MSLERLQVFFYQNPVIIVFIFTAAVLVPRMSLQPHSSKFLCYCTLLVVTKLQLASIAVKFAILFINRTGAYHCWMNKVFLDFRLMKCKM